MQHTVSTRRRLPAALLLTVLILSTLLLPAQTAGAGSPAPTKKKASSISRTVCNQNWRKGPAEVKKLIRCAAKRWKVPGGAVKAIRIAYRESKFKPRAYNSGSGASGVFQHLKRYWPRSARKYGFPGWSPFNARANIIVSMRMAKDIGWWPWGG